MANIIWPENLCPRTFSLQLEADVRTYAATFGGSELVTDMQSDFWTATMEIDSRSGSEAAALEALVNYIQGGIHTVEFYHFARSLPSGTVSLTSSVVNSAAIGASSITISATSGSTVKAGDIFSAGDLLLMCSEDCVASSNNITVPIVNRLRTTVSAGAFVNFNKPTLKFRHIAASGLKNLAGSSSSPVTMSFVEDI